jgi:hypothetical protein
MDAKPPDPAAGPPQAGKAKPPPLPNVYEVNRADLISIPAEPYVGPTEPEPRPASAAPPPTPPPKPAPAVAPQPQQAPPLAPVKAEWKVLEPEDRSDPVAHEICEHRPRGDGWELLAASIRGKLHAHKAQWRDDTYRTAWVGDWTVIALADGAGSARLARVGANVACEEAVNAVREQLAVCRLSPSEDDVPSPVDQETIRRVLVEGALRARHGILREVNERRCAIRDFNTTFLLALHTPFGANALVGALQIGDGAIGVYTKGDDCQLVGAADHGEYSSETCFLTTPGIEEQFRQRTHVTLFKRGIRCLAVMCDGVSDDFFPESKRLIELFTGNPISELKTRQGDKLWGVMHKDQGIFKDPRGGQALLGWLKYEKRGSSDDRTLILLYRREQP